MSGAQRFLAVLEADRYPEDLNTLVNEFSDHFDTAPKRERVNQQIQDGYRAWLEKAPEQYEWGISEISLKSLIWTQVDWSIDHVPAWKQTFWCSHNKTLMHFGYFGLKPLSEARVQHDMSTNPHAARFFLKCLQVKHRSALTAQNNF